MEALVRVTPRPQRPRMLLVDNRGITDARVNLALEEHVLRTAETDEDLLLFYVNAPAIIIGRNQNTIEEINPPVVAERDIRVVRRISGGGAVYHDLGNLNFSFMTRDVSGHFSRYDKFNQPVVDVLRDLGVPAELNGRNDILAAGRKISGNAQFAGVRRMFSHGTLLFDSDLDHVSEALRPRPGKVESKGVKSVRSRVANISEFISQPLTVAELRERIIARIFGTSDPARVPTLPLMDGDWDSVRQLVDEKYGTWAWNFGENPACNVQRAQRFPGGEIDVRIDVQGGRILALRIFGDFMGRADVREVETRLLGVPYDRAAMLDALGKIDLADYFGAIAHADALEVLCP